MGRKIVIVGGVAGGASTATKLRRNSEEDQIIMFEKGPHVSFSNCALPYYLSGTIKKAEKLILMNPEKFKKQYKIDARVNHEVVAIDREKKQIVVRNFINGETYTESYDKLVLSPGAVPIVPNIDGINLVNLFTLRNVVDIERLNQFVSTSSSKDVVVIGGGFIGVEVAENLRNAQYNVTLVEGSNQILHTFDYDMVQIFHKEMVDHGIDLIVEDTVVKFEENMVVLSSGRKIPAGTVVMAIGVRPETTLAKAAGIELGETGAIKTDENYCTNDIDIYAIGDAIEVTNALTNKKMKLSLAGPALKQARTVAEHIHQKETIGHKYIGSSAIRVFNYNGAATGLSEEVIHNQGLKIEYEIVRIVLSDKVGIMPDASQMHLKVLFEVPTGKILGAQAIGKGDVTKRIDVIATVMKFSGTIYDLKELELSYAPLYSTAKDIVNYAGYVGCNLLHGTFKQINVDKVRELVENDCIMIDVREQFEYQKAHIKGAMNIPLSELRDRLDEIPKDQPVYLHCRTGQRSYNAALALQNYGYRNVVNVTGSFLALSFYEFYNDQRLKRESIMTDYNFV